MATLTPTQSEGLTTKRAPFIEESQSRGDLFIEQPYHLYNEDNQESWRRLYSRMTPRWQRYAHPRFLEGVNNLALSSDAVPRLEDINRFLEPLSAFKAKAVAGYVPAYMFFDCLRQREFPTTITIRDKDTLDYLPEPDIFHDVAGHVPMHTDRHFSDVLVRFGEVARAAAKRALEIPDQQRRVHVVESNIKALARFFWFTVEFGLMRHEPGSEESRSTDLACSLRTEKSSIVSLRPMSRDTLSNWSGLSINILRSTNTNPCSSSWTPSSTSLSRSTSWKPGFAKASSTTSAPASR